MAIFGASDAPAKRLGLIVRNTTNTLQSALTGAVPSILAERDLTLAFLTVARGPQVFIVWRYFMTRLLWFLYVLLLIAAMFGLFWFIYSCGVGTR